MVSLGTIPDARARATPAQDRWSETDARSMLVALQRSGQSVAALARSQGVTAQRIYWWRQRLEPTGGRAAIPAAVGLAPVRVRYEDAMGLAPMNLGAPVIVVRSLGGVVIECRALCPRLDRGSFARH
ncbi:MAG: hypothetical protein IPK13_21695 [Deltaproteobacteria bacterium]|nr:hypothetical protein [Deltaproteobacteria bacterium]